MDPEDDRGEKLSDQEEAGDAEIIKGQARAARIAKEKTDLLEALAKGNFSSIRTKVAAVLNLYPHARNSDVALALKYWESFQPDLYNPAGIKPSDLFKLEGLHYIVRARAKIQNDYGLFQADEKIRRHRRNHEEKMHAAVVEDGPPRRVVYVYSDETGKNQDYVLIASVWVLTGHAVFKVSRAIDVWKSRSNWATREVHFSKFGRADMATLLEYLDVVSANREYLSFKVMAVERARTRRSIEDVVEKLHEHMLVRGTEHEIETGRIDLPRELEVTVDEEQALDLFALAGIRQRVGDRFRTLHGEALQIAVLQAASSRDSPMIQLADLVAGAINRRLNHGGERNFKDDMADIIVDRLGLQLAEGEVADLDATALFQL